MITDHIGQHKVLLPINHKNYNFQEKKNSQVMKESEHLHLCRSEIDNSQNGFAGCQVTSEKQAVCQSKTQPCMKNAQLRRTLRNLVKIPNACQGSFSSKIQGF